VQTPGTLDRGRGKGSITPHGHHGRVELSMHRYSGMYHHRQAVLNRRPEDVLFVAPGRKATLGRS